MFRFKEACNGNPVFDPFNTHPIVVSLQALARSANSWPRLVCWVFPSSQTNGAGRTNSPTKMWLEGIPMQFYSICYVMVPGKGRFCIEQFLFFLGNTQQPAVRTAVVWSSNFAICKALIGRMAGVSSPHLLFTVMWQPCLCKLSDWLTFTTVKCSSYKNVERASHVVVPIRQGFAEVRHG